jgi:nucleoside 2-deoxyribosyltransferase
MKTRVYLSGPIFSAAEIEWAGRAKALMEERLEGQVEVVWPHELGAGSPREIFEANVRALDRCGIVVALLDGAQVDDGTAWEVGYHYARKGRVIGVRTDLRKAGETPASRVNAMIEVSCLAIVTSLDQLIEELGRLL